VTTAAARWPIAGSPAAVLGGANKSFDSHTVLDRLDLQIDSGEFVALLGASGSGKTTILRILLGLETLDSGEVLVTPARSTVFQEPRLVPSKRVWRNVVIGLDKGSGTREAAAQALEVVGLSRHVDAWPGTLSGGEAQRVALARALIREPELLLLDEPFAALDALTRLKMQRQVADLVDRYGPGVLLVTHDVEEALVLADRVVVLEHGRICLDRRVELPKPRRIGGEAFDTLRDELLAQLGVDQSDRQR